LVYGDDIIIIAGSVHTRQEHAETSVQAGRDIGLDINAEKTKYLVMSRDQNAGCHSIKNDNNSFESTEEFKHLGTTFTNQNSIQEEINSQLKSGNAYYYSMQNLMSSNLLSKI
jgi:hypothetical protein